MRSLASFVVLAAVLAAPASASAFKVGDGVTTVLLDRKATKALDKLGVELTAKGAAEAGRRGVAFPTKGGKLVGLSGSVRHAGGLKLSKGRRSVKLSRLRVVLKDRPFVQARVGDGKLKAFTLDVDDAQVRDDVTGSVIADVELDLSRQGARALNRTFRTKAFETGTKLGDVVLAAGARAVRFTDGQTDLALDPDAAAALTSLGIAVAPAQGTISDTSGTLAFPITGGRLVGTELVGQILHQGGIVLSKESTSVRLTDFIIDTKRSLLLGRVNGSAKRVALLNLDLDGGDLSATDSRLTIEDVRARLTNVAAKALNQAFATNAFQAGLTLGVAAVRGIGVS